MAEQRDNLHADLRRRENAEAALADMRAERDRLRASLTAAAEQRDGLEADLRRTQNATAALADMTAERDRLRAAIRAMAEAREVLEEELRQARLSSLLVRMTEDLLNLQRQVAAMTLGKKVQRRESKIQCIKMAVYYP